MNAYIYKCENFCTYLGVLVCRVITLHVHSICLINIFYTGLHRALCLAVKPAVLCITIYFTYM
jgi:hypothetical protein